MKKRNIFQKVYYHIKILFKDDQTGIYRNLTFKKVLNYIKNMYSAILRKPYVNSYPIHIRVDPANSCQLKCPLCPIGQGLPSRAKGMMRFDDYKKIINQLGDYIISLSIFSWGEPLLNKDVFKMIKYAAGRKIFIDMSSNFSYFNEYMAESLIESQLSHLIVSMDGATQETYETYRMGGKLDKLINNVKLLVKKKEEMKSSLPFITIRFLVMAHNEHEIPEIKRIGKELGVNRVEIAPVMVNIKDDAEVKRWLPKNESLSMYDYKKRVKKQKLVFCRSLWQSPSINTDGSLAPCCYLYHESNDFGNIFKEDFDAIWNNEYYQASRNLFNNLTLSHVSTVKTPCSTCLTPFLTSTDEDADIINESLTNKQVFVPK